MQQSEPILYLLALLDLKGLTRMPPIQIGV